MYRMYCNKQSYTTLNLGPETGIKGLCSAIQKLAQHVPMQFYSR